MQTFTLDLTCFEEAASVQGYLMSMLDFPFYYGKNLDALYDELTSWSGAVCFRLILPAKPQGGMADYLPRLVRVFQEAAAETPGMTIEITEK